MGTKDKRIDAYIAKAAPFARPILTYLRAVVHAACPDVEETIKWSMPAFDYNGPFCSMAAFKQHATFGFWKGALIVDPKTRKPDEAMGDLGRITRVADLPGKRRAHGVDQTGDGAQRRRREGADAQVGDATQGAARPGGPEGRAGREQTRSRDV